MVAPQGETKPGLPAHSPAPVKAGALFLCKLLYGDGMKKPLTFCRAHWEWIVCFTTLSILGLFLLGYDWFGLNGPLAGVLGLVGGIVLPIVLLVFGVIFAPILFFVGGALTMILGLLTALFMMVVAPVIGFLVGAVVVPLIALVTGLITSLMAWLATTWLGIALAPVINAAAPFVMQYGPWLAFGKNSTWLYDKIKKNERLKKIMAAYFKGKKEGKAVAKDVAETVETTVEHVVDVVEVKKPDKKKPIKRRK